MNRALYAAGWGVRGALRLWFWSGAERIHAAPSRPHRRRPVRGAAGEWFAQVKPFCNAVEVEVRQQQLPAPATVEGAGYSAACYALAGKIDRAREVIDRLGAGDRRTPRPASCSRSAIRWPTRATISRPARSCGWS